MAENPQRIVAPPGSQVWNRAADLLKMAPGLNVRPATIPFRTATLVASGQAQQTLRVNPMYHFYWTHTSVWVETLAADVASSASHATVQIQGGAGIPVFDQPVPLSAYGSNGLDAGGTLPIWTPNTLSILPAAIEWAFAAGEDITVFWVADATFPAAAHILDFVMHGVYIHARAEVAQVKQVLELAQQSAQQSAQRSRPAGR